MSKQLLIEKIELGIIKGSANEGGTVFTHQGTVSAENQAKDIFFTLDSNSYVYFDLLDTNYDLDLKIYRDNPGEIEDELLATSDNEGVDGESVFKFLGAGDYTAFLYPYIDAIYPLGGVNYKLEIDTKTFLENTLLPNDPLFGSQWHLFNTGQGTGSDNSDIMAPEGWKIQSTSPDIIVAVIDGGVDLNHPDLVENIWVNPGEVTDNGIDDDANGFIDDINGWNFYHDTNVINVTSDGDDHGTHVAGTIGATGDNGIGVTGVTWDTQIMSLTVFEAFAEGAGDIPSAIYYAANKGARVINMSLGLDYEGSIDDYIAEFPDDHQLYFDALTYAVNKGATIVIAAGNANNSFDSNWISSPAYFSELIPGVISVAASGNTSQRAEYSNYGSRVTISAPGGDYSSSEDGVVSDGLFATYPLQPQETDPIFFDNGYGYMQGTSMAAPVVTGAIALLLQKHPDLTPAQVEEAIVKSAPTSKALKNVSKNGGYLDLYSLLTYFEVEDTLELINIVASLAENTSTSTRIKVADIIINDDALGSNSISLEGADAASFEVIGTELFLKAGIALDFESKASYTVNVSASDASLPGSTPVSAAFKLAVSDVNEAPESRTVQITATSGGSRFTVDTTDDDKLIVNLQGSPDLIAINVQVAATLNAISTETWTLRHIAYNAGTTTKAGTGERISLNSIGKYSFVAKAIPEATTEIVMEQGKNTAFFLDDAYSAFYTGLTLTADSTGRQSHQRALNVDTIVMGSGGGTSIVDLTSKDYVTGAVTVYGADKGRSIFWGTDSNDTFISGGGDSVIFGGAGSNSASLGTGHDTLQYRAGVGAVDRVEGFDRTKDAVELWVGKGMVTIEPQFTSVNGSTSMKWGANTVEFVGIPDLTLSNLKIVNQVA